MAVGEASINERVSSVDEDLKKLLETRKANIRVVGVGGAGNNTLSRMMQVGIVGADVIEMILRMF
jgi:cell division protein FtsZ